MDKTIERMKKRLSEELIKQGMLPADLAKKAGVDRGTVDNYLSPHISYGNIEIWLKFSKALGYEGLEWLIV